MATKATNGKPQARFALNDGNDIILRNQVRDMVANLTSARREFFNQFEDRRRNIDDECGYPKTGTLGPDGYRDLYDRDPLANRVVQLMPKECWRTEPLVYEHHDDTISPFEEDVDNLELTLAGTSWHTAAGDGSAVNAYLARLDALSRIGSYGVLLFGFDDGRRLDEPVEGAVVANAAVLPDCWATQDEEDKLRALPKLTANERQAIDAMAAYRQAVFNRAEQITAHLRNQGSPAKVTPEMVLNGAHFAVANKVADSAADLLGTDAQYLGVQFGPSETASDKPAGKKRKLLFLRVFDESLVQVVRYEWNMNNPRFGQPVMYRVTLNDPREQHSGVGLPQATVFVHWTRILHAADVHANACASEIFAPPVMRPCLNPILDARKVRAASAEGYWKSAFLQLSFETHPQLGGDVVVDKDAMSDLFENAANGLQRAWATSGMTVNPIAPGVTDPTPFLANYHKAIAVQLGCPVPVFEGYEIGEQASDNNAQDWRARVKERQNCYLTPRMLVPFYDRLILVGVVRPPARATAQKTVENWVTNGRGYARRAKGGYLLYNAEFDDEDVEQAEEPAPREIAKAAKFVSDNGFTVEWPALDTASAKDKAAVAAQLTAADAAYVAGGNEAIMTPRDYYVHRCGMTEEQADAIVTAAAEAADETLTMPPRGEEGHPATVPPPPEPAPQMPIKVKDGETLVNPQDVIGGGD